LGEADSPEGNIQFSEIPASTAKRAWARLIKHVYEVDPLVCPRCTGPMRLIACIEQPEVIEKILTHLGLWPARPLPCRVIREVAPSTPEVTGVRPAPIHGR
jgi:hypothetical protein